MTNDNAQCVAAAEHTRLPWVIAALAVLFLLWTNHGYGFHRDELATLDDARDLAWGFVAYPPLTPLFGWISLHLFGTSLAGFRFFASVASMLVAVITAAMTRELGGGKIAQILAATATLGFGLATGSLMQYVAFDYLWWVLTMYFFLRLANTDDARWWIALGVSIGLGMLTKYSMLFCIAGLAVAFVFSKRWRDLKTPWFWAGVLCSILIFLPNLLWQMSHQFVSLDFLRHIHERDVRIGRTKNFLPEQLELTLFAFPLFLLGIWFLFFSKNGRRWRALGWLYVVPLILFILARGRAYYLAPAYPLLYAAGCAWIASMASRWSASPRALVWTAVSLLLAANVVFVCAFALPLAPVASAWWQRALKTNGDLAEEFGWPELVQALAQIRDSLGVEERGSTAILAGNYGEAGAVNLYGPRFGLPPAISGANSFWARGYGDPPPKTVILIGFSAEFVDQHFEAHEFAGQVTNRVKVSNEESKDYPGIFICRGLKESWPAFWKKMRHYG